MQDEEGDPNLNLYVENATNGYITGDEYDYAGWGYPCTIDEYPGKTFFMICAICKK